MVTRLHRLRWGVPVLVCIPDHLPGPLVSPLAGQGEACKEFITTIFTTHTTLKPSGRDLDQARLVEGMAFEMVLVQQAAISWSMDATTPKVPALRSEKLSSLVGIEVTATENETEGE